MSAIDIIRGILIYMYGQDHNPPHLHIKDGGNWFTITIKDRTLKIKIMILLVESAEYMGKYTLLCTFNNGERRKVDLTPLLKYPAFEELKDESEFERYGVDGTVFWANGADIAPEYLFENGTPC